MYSIRKDQEYIPKRLKIWGLGLFLALQINVQSHNSHHNSVKGIQIQELANINLSYKNYPSILINNCIK